MWLDSTADGLLVWTFLLLNISFWSHVVCVFSCSTYVWLSSLLYTYHPPYALAVVYCSVP